MRADTCTHGTQGVRNNRLYRDWQPTIAIAVDCHHRKPNRKPKITYILYRGCRCRTRDRSVEFELELVTYTRPWFARSHLKDTIVQMAPQNQESIESKQWSTQNRQNLNSVWSPRLRCNTQNLNSVLSLIDVIFFVIHRHGSFRRTTTAIKRMIA